MTWRSQEREKARTYRDPEDARAFRSGYSDGYHGYPQRPGDWNVNAYNAGYWEGYGDKNDETRGYSHEQES